MTCRGEVVGKNSTPVGAIENMKTIMNREPRTVFSSSDLLSDKTSRLRLTNMRPTVPAITISKGNTSSSVAVAVSTSLSRIAISPRKPPENRANPRPAFMDVVLPSSATSSVWNITPRIPTTRRSPPGIRNTSEAVWPSAPETIKPRAERTKPAVRLESASVFLIIARGTE